MKNIYSSKNHIDKFVKRYAHLFFMLLFPIVLFYYDSVFKISTMGIREFFTVGTIYSLFFNLSYGLLVYLLCSLFKKRVINKTITSIIIAALAIPYLIEYFIFRQFKIFYDVNTITGGAEDAVGGFMSEIKILIFSFDGIFKILLFALPLILYLIFGRRFVPAYKSNLVIRLISGIGSVVVYGITILLITFNSIYQPLFTSQYNFQSAIPSFGFYSAIGLDIKNILFEEEISFDSTDLQTLIPVDPEKEEIFKEYGYNQLDIDFEKLAEGAKKEHKTLDQYVASLTASKQNQYTGMFKGKNLIMITAEAFTKEVIDPELTPTLYRLATKGINFTDYYAPASAGTTGGEYSNVFGMLPTAGGKSFKNTADNNNYYTMGSQLNRLGYFGMAFHNNSYTYYDRHKTHINLGYSNGYMGYGNGIEEFVNKAWPQSDLEMMEGTLLKYIPDDKPFNFYYMSVSGHSGYSQSGNKMTKKNWDKVQHLNYSDTVKGYIAANLELESALTRTLEILEQKGILNDTVICISTDHFPYGLDADAGLGSMPYLSELYGYDVTDYFQRDHNALILWSGCLEDKEPIIVDTPTYSLDILPTLSNLFGTEFDSRLMVGRDVFSDAEPLVFNTNYDWKTQYGTFYAKNGKFVESTTNPLPEGTDEKEYINAIKAIVKDKYKYCKGVLDSDYYDHVFG